MKGSDIVLILIAIIFPPIAALMVGGCCDFLINLCLTLLGFIPGHIHAFWLIYRRAKADEQYAGHYTYVGSGHFQPTHPGQNNSRTHLQQPQHPAHPQQNYQQPPQQPQQALQPQQQQQQQFNPPQKPYGESARGTEVAPGPVPSAAGGFTSLPPAYKD